MFTNQDIRREVKEAGLRLWEIGESLGLNDCNLSRKLRHELNAEEKAKIRAIIAEIKEAK
jgi:hypothetical protein